MAETFRIARPIELRNPYSNIDHLYGAYDSIESANSSVLKDVRRVGLTVGIKTGETIGEYWYQGGIEDSNLVKKLSNPYTAGDNITIEDNVISAQDTTYTAGDNVTIDRNNVISATGVEYIAGDNIQIDGNVINAIIPNFQKQLVAGDNITIENDSIISAQDTTYTAGDNITIDPNNVISAYLPTPDVTSIDIYVDSKKETQGTGSILHPYNDMYFLTSFEGDNIVIHLSTGTYYLPPGNLNINRMVIEGKGVGQTNLSRMGVDGGGGLVAEGCRYLTLRNINIGGLVFSSTDNSLRMLLDNSCSSSLWSPPRFKASVLQVTVINCDSGTGDVTNSMSMGGAQNMNFFSCSLGRLVAEEKTNSSTFGYVSIVNCAIEYFYHSASESAAVGTNSGIVISNSTIEQYAIGGSFGKKLVLYNSILVGKALAFYKTFTLDVFMQTVIDNKEKLDAM